MTEATKTVTTLWADMEEGDEAPSAMAAWESPVEPRRRRRANSRSCALVTRGGVPVRAFADGEAAARAVAEVVDAAVAKAAEDPYYRGAAAWLVRERVAAETGLKIVEDLQLWAGRRAAHVWVVKCCPDDVLPDGAFTMGEPPDDEWVVAYEDEARAAAEHAQKASGVARVPLVQ